MNIWSTLAKTALLGTDKARLPDTLLPEVLQSALSQVDANDREAYFYKAASLTYLYEKAGGLPPNTPIPSINQAPEEQQAQIPDRFRPLIQELLREEPRSLELIAYFFERMIQKNWILPPEFLVRFLHLAAVKQNQRTLGKQLPQVAGARGVWMQQFNAAWKFMSPPPIEQIMQEGKLAERQQLLSDIRKTNPGLALSLLKDAIAETSNVREHSELIWIFKYNPNAEETAFLESLFTDLPLLSTKSNGTKVELRRELAETLLASPHSNLFRSITTRMKNYATPQKAMLGLRNKYMLQIPNVPDDLFCSAIQCEQLGFDRVSPEPNLSEPAFWFSEIVRCLHPVAWEEILPGLSWKEIFAVFEKSEQVQKQGKLPMLHHLSLALVHNQYRKAIQTYVREYQVVPSNIYMLSALNLEEIEQYIMNKSQGEISSWLREILMKQNKPWSKPFSRYIVKCFTSPKSEPYHFYHQEYSKMLALNVLMDPAVLDDLFEISRSENLDNTQKQTRSQFVIPLIRLLELRQSIDHHFSKVEHS